MTVNIVFGSATDGHLVSTSTNYTSVRDGAAVTPGGGTVVWAGQSKVSSTSYQQRQGFIGFSYAAPTADMVITSAVVRLQVASMATPGIARDLEVRGYSWSPGGLTAADWRNRTNLPASPLRALAQGMSSATPGKYVYAGGDDLLANILPGVTVQDFVLATNRERAGTVPTVDEHVSFWSADASGTSQDPALIFTAVTRDTLFGNLGAAARLSDGTSVALEGSGLTSPNLSLVWHNHAGTSSATLGAPLVLGVSATSFAVPAGMQAFAVVAGADDSVYVIGRAGDAEGSIRIVTWTHSTPAPGVHDWSYSGMATVAMGSHDAAINQVAACAVSSSGLESLVVLTARTSGTGWPGGHSGDVSYALLNTAALRAGTGPVSRATGSALDALFPAELSATDWTGYVNQVGTGLDVVADPGNPGWFYANSFRRRQTPGDNMDLFLARGILSAGHDALELASYESGLGYGTKDASAKVRAVWCGPGLAAHVSADGDELWGLTINIRQHFGTTPGSVGLGGTSLAGESIPSMPDGPAVTGSHAWDVVYNATDNALWIYYVDVANPARLMRTAFSLSTMQATREERQVRVAGGPISGVRVARNGATGDRTRVYLATTVATVLTLEQFTDSFNVAPTAPTPLPRDGFDATAPGTLYWTFNDPNVGDVQSSRRVWIEVQSTGVLVLDTGKVASAVTSYIVAAGTLVNGQTYRWRVQDWDSEDLVSPWSAWGVFQTAAGGAVTITLPATDNPPGVTTDDLEIRWSVAGTVQAAYRVWLYRSVGNVLVSDTGWVTSVATVRTITGMVSDAEHRVEVQVRNSTGVMSNVGTRLVTPSYGTPEVPVLTVEPRPDQGYVLLQVRNPLPGEPEAGNAPWDFDSGPIPADWYRDGGTAETSTAQFHGGTASLLLTSNGMKAQAVVRAPTAPVVAGARYTVRAWVYRPVAGSVTLSIDWGNPGYMATSAFATAVPAATWTEILTSGTAPAGAVNASYGPTLTGTPPAGTLLYVDDLILTLASDRPEVASNLILRRAADSGDPWEVVGTCPSNGELRDYTAAGRVPYEYVARGVTA